MEIRSWPVYLFKPWEDNREWQVIDRAIEFGCDGLSKGYSRVTIIALSCEKRSQERQNTNINAQFDKHRLHALPHMQHKLKNQLWQTHVKNSRKISSRNFPQIKSIEAILAAPEGLKNRKQENNANGSSVCVIFVLMLALSFLSWGYLFRLLSVLVIALGLLQSHQNRRSCRKQLCQLRVIAALSFCSIASTHCWREGNTKKWCGKDRRDTQTNR